MISRYSRPQMAAIWEPANRFALWLKIEILACEAWAELGVVPREAVAEIQAKATFDMAALVPRIDEIERRTKHDVVAFTEAVAERVGPAARYIHLGLTSSDILDTCLACQMQQAADLLLEDVAALEAVLAELAVKHKRHGHDRPHPRHPRRAHHLRPQAGHVADGDAAGDGAPDSRAREVVSYGQDLRGGGHLRQRPAAGGGVRLRQAGAQAGAHLHPDHPARPPRRVSGGAGHRRRLAGQVRHRDPPPPAHRGPRGGGAVRRRAEGLLGHAPQAQPGHLRADLGPGPPAPGQRAGRAGERGPLARAGHQPLVGRAGDPAGRHHPAGLPAGEVPGHRAGACGSTRSRCSGT